MAQRPNSPSSLQHLGRREFLRRGGRALGATLLSPALLAAAGCEQRSTTLSRPLGQGEPDPADDSAARLLRLSAEPGEMELGPGTTYRSWMYNGRYPGPEIRVREGERLRIAVDNRLPEGTTVHWHGIPLSNPMDGVPGLTQDPIPPGGSMVYEFEAAPAGSYMYHSHVGLQLDRGLLGPLIIEEAKPHVEFDSDHVLVLDDFLPGIPQPLEELAGDGDGGGRMGGMMRGRREGGMMGSRTGGGMMGGMGVLVPPYAGHLINGRLPADPFEIRVRRGERARLRLINPASATTYRVAIAGHRMTVTHADARPVEPVMVDSLTIGMGERYDVIIQADEPGIWPIAALPIEGDGAPACALLRYTDATASAVRDGLPEGLQRGRRLRYADLQSVETLPERRTPDRTFDLRLAGGMMMRPDVWTIDGETYPDAPPLEIEEGERIRVNMTNMSMMLHPMHLHGHFFRAGNALKDTILVDPHMGRVSLDFIADNPGRWLFHCHNLYHMEAGMAREFRYV